MVGECDPGRDAVDLHDVAGADVDACGHGVGVEAVGAVLKVDLGAGLDDAAAEEPILCHCLRPGPSCSAA